MVSIRSVLGFMVMLLLVSGCTEDNGKNKNSKAKKEEDKPEVEIVTDISRRQLFVVKKEDTIRTYDIAVGKAEYPTPTGKFKIHQIDFNPDWTPPESDWSKDKEYTPPGHPKNPMGRVRIVYQKPYSIHGTKDLSSLGEAESHGSIRMANDDVIELAKLIMKESDTRKPNGWYNDVLRDSTKMVSVKLENKVPLRNKK